MYSTNLKDNRYLVRCVTVARNINVNKFVIDTGAKFTCCNCGSIEPDMREHELSNCETRLLGGFIKGEFVKFYQYQLRQFSIGNIDMGQQKIWVTFDSRITDMVLGMDVLKQIIIVTNPYNLKIYFCKDADDYQQNFELVVSR